MPFWNLRVNTSYAISETCTRCGRAVSRGGKVVARGKRSDAAVVKCCGDVAAGMCGTVPGHVTRALIDGWMAAEGHTNDQRTASQGSRISIPGMGLTALSFSLHMYPIGSIASLALQAATMQERAHDERKLSLPPQLF